MTPEEQFWTVLLACAVTGGVIGGLVPKFVLWAFTRPWEHCGARDTGYYHALGQSMPCLRRKGHRGKHRNQWKEEWQ